MTVDAHVFYWTRDGMKLKSTAILEHAVGYVQVGEVQRLLEEAHRRGFEQARQNERDWLAGMLL